ncbi:MAG: hypothetical protein ACOY5F_05460 [Pseudomonadota bacterium]
MLGGLVLKLMGLLGGGAFDALLGRLADYLRAKANDDLARFQTGVQADTQIAIAQVNAQIEARKVQAKLMEADRGWWVTAWIRPLIVYPCVLHFGAIVIDSTFRLGWGIAKLPPPYDGYEQAIILSFFIARPFEKVARVFAAGRG